MNKLIFHKNLLSLVKTRSVEVNLESITDLKLFIQNIYPEFCEHFRKHKTISYTFLIDKKQQIPSSWIYQDKILDRSCEIYVVPVISGGQDALSIFTDSAKFTDFVLKTALSLTVNFALSMVIRALLPDPSDRKDPQRLDNDLFSSIINTVDAGITIPLHYGMTRIGGQYISSEIETATDQRFEDLSENENTELLIPSDGNDPGGGQGNLDSPSSISTTDYRGESLTPDQY